MSERTLIAVVRDLIGTGLSVEQQILVNELVIVAADLQSEADHREQERREWRERQQKKRMSRDITGHHVTPHTPRDSNKYKNPLNPPLETSFEEFYSAYPRKVAKGSAKKAYRNALNRATHAEILAGAKRYAAAKPDPQYTAHPASWLNADRWLDEMKPSATMLSGPWKPFKPEVPDPEKPPAEIREQQLAKLRDRA